MSTEPLTTDDVRKGYAGSRVRHAYYDGGKEEHDYGVERFDAWLAERDRQVAAQALRDAANAYTDFDGDRGTSGVVRRWLRERANDLARADSAAPAPAAPQIAVDGSWGPQTTRALQRVLGTPVDGVISGQYPNAVTRAIPACDFSTRGGSTVIRALQRRLGVPADGYIGPETVSALQRYLGTPVDGVVSRPRSLMVEALQRRLNTGRL